MHPKMAPAAPVLRPVNAYARNSCAQRAQRLVGHGCAAQPLPVFWQHHAFFSADQPNCQFSYPAAQSNGMPVVAQPPVGAHPLPVLVQHHIFFAAVHEDTQFA